MAATVTMQQLRDNLKVVEDDLGSFIKSQKNNLRKEKLHLERNAQGGRHRVENAKFQPPSSPSSPAIKEKMTEENNGLNLGGYEIKQEKLREERKREYKQYLDEQSKRRVRGGNNTLNGEMQKNGEANMSTSRKYIASPVQNRKEYKTDIDKEYSSMLQKKKNEESLYRGNHDVANDSTEYEPERIHGKKIIEFDDSDDELFKYVLKQKEKNRRPPRIGSASEKTRTLEVQNDPCGCNIDDDGRSSSVPPPKVPYIFGGSSHANVRNMKNREHKEALEEQIKEKQFSKVNNSSHVGLAAPNKMPYIFGGSSHAMMRRQKNIEHKQALEDQIKEKEEIKNREKLKRIGKATRTFALDQSNQYPSNVGISDQYPSNVGNEDDEVLNNDITKLVKTDQNTPYSNQNGVDKRKRNMNLQQGNVYNDNMNGGYPNQNSYGVNPMFNPMMMYPGGWPGYGSMLPNVYGPNNMMVPFPQGATTNMQQVDTGMNGKEHVSNSKNIESYIPSAVDKINQYKPSIKIHTSPYITSVGASNEPDLSAKRAQQVAYQNELKKQMEIKKAAAEKDRQEREKYEMKLEKEIASYDPWGKSGCGAPVRAKDGKIVADLRKLLQDKENGTVSTSIDIKDIEDKLPDDLSPLLKALEMSQKTQVPPEKEVQQDTSPSHRRGAFAKELEGLTSPRDKEEQTSYKQFLQKQVEEKKRKEEELKEKARLEEEKENKRLAAQQQRMREEYEEEKEKQRRKAEEIRKENEARGLIAEQKRIEENQKNQQIDDERDAEIKREAELKLAPEATGSSNGIVLPRKSNSPPVPGVAKKERKKTSKHDMIEKENTTESMQYLNTIRDNLNNKNDRQIEMHEQEHLIHQLSALRKQLMRQEEKVQSDLQRNKKEYSNLVSATEWNRNNKINKKSAFDRATSVRSGRKYNNEKFSAMEQLMYDDNYNKEQKDLDIQQQEYMRQQEMRLDALRQDVENSTLPSEFHMNRQASKQSLLESESKFFSIDGNKVMGNNTQGKYGYNNKDPTQVKNGNHLHKTLNTPDVTDTPSKSESILTLQVESIAQKNEERLANLNDADIAQKNKERLNKLEQDEGSGVNIESNEKIITDNDFTLQDE